MFQLINRVVGVLGLLLMLLPGVSFGAEATQALEPSVEDQIRTALERKIEMEFVEAPLSDVIDFIRSQVRVPMYIVRRALDEGGVATDTPITAQFRDTRLSVALKTMLRELELTYLIDDDMLLITTVSDADARMFVRVYDVTDLVTEPGNPLDGETPSSTLCEELKSVLEETVAPQTWVDVGGAGSLKWQRCRMIVSQSFHVHEDLNKLLVEIRRARRTRAASKQVLNHDATPGDGQLVTKIYAVVASRPATVGHGMGMGGGHGMGRASPVASGGVYSVDNPFQPNDETKPDETKTDDHRAAADEKLAAAMTALGQSLQATTAALNNSTSAAQLRESNERDRTDLDARRQITKSLFEIIPLRVAPQSWQQGGGEGTIDVVGENLLVKQTPAVHHELAQMFKSFLVAAPQ